MTSQYMPESPPGSIRNGIRCEDVQRLSFEDNLFDLCTSTEVFEHVADDQAGFTEIRRVLRPGGVFIFTVPLSGAEHTVERARILNGQVVHLLEPEYHGDPFSSGLKALCMRSYGIDIVERLRDAGFIHVKLVSPTLDMMHYARTVVVAKR